MKRVEDLIWEYMKALEVDYREAIAFMMADLETAKDDEELQADSEYNAKQ